MSVTFGCLYDGGIFLFPSTKTKMLDIVSTIKCIWFYIRKEPLILPITNGAKQSVFVTVIVIFAIFWIFWYFLLTECFERNDKLSTSMKLNQQHCVLDHNWLQKFPAFSRLGHFGKVTSTDYTLLSSFCSWKYIISTANCYCGSNGLAYGNKLR